MTVQVQVKATINDPTPSLMSPEHFCATAEIWNPVVVWSQQEKDYLLGMALMVGYDLQVYLEDVEAIPDRGDASPTYARVYGL